MRYGNKSVISEIREDDDMPFTEDGVRVDLLLNLLAIINRTTSMPLFELAITSISRQIQKRMSTLPSFEEKRDLLLEYLTLFNQYEAKSYKKEFKSLSREDQEKWIEDTIEHGIYLYQPPLHEDEAIFHRINRILQRFDFIHPDKIYVKKWGQMFRTLNDNWIGDMYILKLKQSDRRGFSVRSTGAVDIKGLPTRSHKNKNHLEQTSTSAIRFGEFETLNLSIGLPMEDIALFHALYRTSIKGRKDLVKMQFSDPDSKDHYINIDKKYDSRVIEIFEVIFKSLGIGIDFVEADSEVYPTNMTIAGPHKWNNTTIICTDHQFYVLKKAKELRDIIMEDKGYMELNELESTLDDHLRFYHHIDKDDTSRHILGDLLDEYVL